MDSCFDGSFQIGKGFLLSRYTDRADYQVTSDGDINLELTILFISTSMMQAMLGADLAVTVAEALQLTVIPSFSILQLPHNVSSLLCAYPHEHYIGKMRKLHAQSKAIEFICSLSDYIILKNNCRSEVKSVGKKRLIELLHEELLSLDGRIPTLDELARQFDTSARVLNNGFKEIYGCSINTYISGRRLDSAHEALVKTDMPMKILAANLGYSHVNHFITAFRKKYGYSPGSLRK
jgi:AraC-like DNA-binding protein